MVRPSLVPRTLAVVAVVSLIAAGCAVSGTPSGASGTTIPASSDVSSSGIPTVSAAPAEPSSSPTGEGLRVVAVGDSIPFNSPQDCPGCTGFVARLGELLGERSGKPVEVLNLSQRNGLQAAGLSVDLDTDADQRAAISEADVVIVSIGHNDTPWNVSDDACDGAADWGQPLEKLRTIAAGYTAACGDAAAQAIEPKLASIYQRIVALRESRPTTFLALNTYNDWAGWCEHRGCEGGVDVTPPEIEEAAWLALEPMNEVVCETATGAGMICADIYHLFNGAEGTTAAGDLLAQDYTHPSQEGNDEIAALLFGLISE